ncbi:MAG: Dyp-type peroxidase [Nocardioides sp.]
MRHRPSWGYQRPDETEPFGYRDGVRNVRASKRLDAVYVHTGAGQPDEPAWTDGGTYMVTMKIAQNVRAFGAIDEASQDQVIGRTKDGRRLDLGEGTDPHEEGAEVPEGLPVAAHVRKAGPRGQHDDTEIFRRGMPFVEVTGGVLSVGLHFCSFQATPNQFDAVFNDWMMNPLFPKREDGSAPGRDALLAGVGPDGRPFVEFKQAGVYFVPPHLEGGLAEAFAAKAPSKRSAGRIAINKVVLDPTDATKRFERGGFQFEVRDDKGVAVPESQFTTASNGRGVCAAELEVGQVYALVETVTPRTDLVPLEPIQFTMDKPNKLIKVENRLVGQTSIY